MVWLNGFLKYKLLEDRGSGLEHRVWHAIVHPLCKGLFLNVSCAPAPPSSHPGSPLVLPAQRMEPVFIK